jgi:hypothetical protein
MKKDYSKIFGHYYGLQYDGHVEEMIKIHQLMEDAGMQVSGSTKDKLAAYSDKRPFRVNYFISKVGKTLKWCPTNSPEKFAKMILMTPEWWFEQLTDVVEVQPATSVELPSNWLDVQLTEHVKNMLLNDDLPVTRGPVTVSLDNDLVTECELVEDPYDAILSTIDNHDEELPF